MVEQPVPAEQEIHSSPEKSLLEQVRESVEKDGITYQGLMADFWLYGNEEFRKGLGEQFTGMDRLGRTVEQLYPSLSAERRLAILVKADETLKKEGISLTDKEVSLFKFFDIKGPKLVAESVRKEIEAEKLVPDKKEEEQPDPNQRQELVGLRKKVLQLEKQLDEEQFRASSLEYEKRKLQNRTEELHGIAQRMITDPDRARMEYEYQFMILKENRVLSLDSGKGLALQKRIGGGKYSEVWLAKTAEGQEVVVKMMRPDLTEKEKWAFKKEMETLLDLSYYIRTHNLEVKENSLVPLFLGKGKVEGKAGNYEFFTMTHASGRPLDECMRENKYAKREFSQKEALIIISQFCRVLEALHEGIGKSYLDFQLKNIFWDEEEKTIMVVDWNLLSKEKDFNPQIDLGVAVRLLYTMLMGASPAKDIPLEKLKKELAEKGLAIEIQRILERGLTGKQLDRYQEARELRQDLEEIKKRN